MLVCLTSSGITIKIRGTKNETCFNFIDNTAIFSLTESQSVTDFSRHSVTVQHAIKQHEGKKIENRIPQTS